MNWSNSKLVNGIHSLTKLYHGFFFWLATFNLTISTKPHLPRLKL
jgi:hypothetical protein